MPSIIFKKLTHRKGTIQIKIVMKLKLAFLNLIDICNSVLSGRITFRYGFRRLKSQALLVGKRFVDGVNWANYHKDYAQELKSIQKFNTIVIDPEQIGMKNSKINYKSDKILPLIPSHKLLYETILNIKVNRVLEVGCGGGDHLYNLSQLDQNLDLFGVDRSEEQLKLFKKRHEFFYSKVNPKVVDLTKHQIAIPNIDLIFSQAVFMHISEQQNRFFNAFNNIFTQSNNYIILMENWTQHNFLDVAQKIMHSNQSWYFAKTYFTQSEVDPKIRCMIISKHFLNLEPLLDYNQLLSGSKLTIH